MPRSPIVALILVSAVNAADVPVEAFRTPESYAELSTAEKDVLAREGCRIPQGTIEGKVVETNVISAELAVKTQIDRAVLCADPSQLYIRVFWGGPVQCPTRIDLQELGGRDFAFDRAIGTVDGKFIREHFEAYGGTTPPKITHLGIEYAFLEKGSNVYYCHEGAWVELSGAD